MPSPAPVKWDAPPWAARFALLLFLGHLPLLVAFIGNLWQKPHYHFFPLAVAGAVYFALTRVRQYPGTVSPGPRWPGLLLLGAAFVLLVVACHIWSPWLGAINLLVTLVAAAWVTGGRDLARRLTPAWLMLATIIPPPFHLDTALTHGLRSLAVQWGSRALDAFRLPHVVNGSILEVPGHRLFVEEACSGINSVLSVTAICLFYTLWRRRPAWHVVVMLGATLGSVLLGNLTRIAAGALLKVRLGIDILAGWPHDLIGLVLYACYLWLIVSTDKFLFFLTPPKRKRKRDSGGNVPAPGLPAAFLTARPAMIIGYAFVVLGVFQIGKGWARVQRAAAAPETVQATSSVSAMTLSMPDQIGSWTRVGDKDEDVQWLQTVGKFSHYWTYRNNYLLATVAIDYPFDGYHDLTVCYRNQGWTKNLQNAKVEQHGEGKAAYMFAQMDRDQLVWASLWFGLVDETGQWLYSPGESFLGQSFFRFQREQAQHTGRCYQMQVLTQTFQPLRPRDIEQVEQLFLDSRQMLAAQVVSNAGGQP